MTNGAVLLLLTCCLSALMAFLGLPPLPFAVLVGTGLILFFVLPFAPLSFFLAGGRRAALPLLLPVGIVFGTILLSLAQASGFFGSAAFLLGGAGFLVLGLERRRILSFLGETSPAFRLLAVFLLLGAVWILPATSGDATIRPDGSIRFATQDGIYHVSVIKQCLLSAWPQQPNLGAEKMHYHFFMHAYTAHVSRLSGLDVETVYGHWGRVVGLLSFVTAFFFLAERLLPGRAWVSAAMLTVLMAHGLHTAWYWILALGDGVGPATTFFSPTHGIRQMAQFFLFGAFFEQAVVCGVIFGFDRVRTWPRRAVLGLLLGASAGFHIPLAAHATVALGVAACYEAWSERRWSGFATSAASSGVLGVLLATGILGGGYGDATGYVPDASSLRIAIPLLLEGLKWFGIETIGLALPLALLARRRHPSPGLAAACAGALIGPLLLLCYNAPPKIMISALYFLQFPSAFLPILSLVLVSSLGTSRGSRVAALMVTLLFIAQILAGFVNGAGITRCRGVNKVIPPELVAPLKVLAGVEADPRRLVATNSILEPNPLRSGTLVSAVTGHPVLLEGEDFCAVLERNDAREALRLTQNVFTDTFDAGLGERLKEMGVFALVEFETGPRAATPLRESWPPLASTRSVRILAAYPDR